MFVCSFPVSFNVDCCVYAVSSVVVVVVVIVFFFMKHSALATVMPIKVF